MKRFFLDFFAIGSAGFVAATLRWIISQWLNRPLLPWGTLLINIIGSLALGWFMTLIGTRLQVSETTRLAVAIGFIGTFTTFSSLMFETHAQFQDRSHWLALAYLAASIILGLVAVRVGVLLAQPR